MVLTMQESINAFEDMEQKGVETWNDRKRILPCQDCGLNPEVNQLESGICGYALVQGNPARADVEKRECCHYHMFKKEHHGINYVMHE